MIALILLGPPGAGKGTLAAEIKKHYQIPHISTGVIFREAIAQKSAMGRQVEKTIAEGKLVSDDLTISLVKERLSQNDCDKGYILDGFPRTLPQAESLETFAAISLVFNLLLPQDEIVKRLSGRRTCPGCGTIYNIYYKPTAREGVCDRCGSVPNMRADDKEEAVLKRLEVYQGQTAPLISYYQEERLLIDLDCNRTVQEIWQDAKKIIDALDF